AMRFYYETAPLPTALAYFCHALPAWWHRVESNLTLVWELCLPLLIWGPRGARRAAFAVFSCFQLLNIATANYGFFSYLALFMGVFLLDDGDLWRVRDFLAARSPPRALRWLSRAASDVRRLRAVVNRAPRVPVRPLRALRCATATIVTASWLGISVDGALHLFARQAFAPLDIIADIAAPFRLVSDYHLFMQVTRERIEPTFEAEVDGKWAELALHYKAGPVWRAPPLVAPHQPRVDFLLWFYGLSFQDAMPPYVASLLSHLCRDPSAVQSLFSHELPGAPQAVRIVFFEYTFTRPGSKDWWTRTEVAHTAAYQCD
ncbi:MAG TPA: lipase maturation factor family protein, partial [Polyangiaceae bacterium]